MARVIRGVVRFVWGHCSAQCVSSGSSIVEVRPGGCGVRPGTLGSLVCALGFDGFIMCSLECALAFVGHFRVAGFIRMRPGCCQVCDGSLHSLWCALGVGGFIRGLLVDMVVTLVSLCSSAVAWVRPVRLLGSSGIAGLIGVRLGCRRVHPGSFGCTLGVVGIIRGRWVH